MGRAGHIYCTQITADLAHARLKVSQSISCPHKQLNCRAGCTCLFKLVVLRQTCFIFSSKLVNNGCVSPTVLLQVPLERFKIVELRKPVLVEGVTVTFLDANHCPGAAKY